MVNKVFDGISGGPNWNWDMFERDRFFPKHTGYVDIFKWAQPDVPKGKATELWLFMMTDHGSLVTFNRWAMDGLIFPTKKFEAKYFNFDVGATRSQAMKLMAWEMLEWLGFGDFTSGRYWIHYDEMCTYRAYNKNSVVLYVTVPSSFMRKKDLPMRVVPLSGFDSFFDCLPSVAKGQEALLRRVLLNIKM